MTNKEVIIKDMINTLFTMDGAELVDMFCNLYYGCSGCPFEVCNCPCGETKEYSRKWLNKEYEVEL